MAKAKTTGKVAKDEARETPAASGRRPQLNCVITPEWKDRLADLIQKFRNTLGVQDANVSDMVLAGLQLLDEWCDQRQAKRAGEVEALGTPTINPELRGVGRPRKFLEGADEKPKRPRGRPRKS